MAASDPTQAMLPREDRLMGEAKRRAVFAPLQYAKAPAPPPAEPVIWPEDNPGGWSLNAVGFLELVRDNPLMWTQLMRAKYLQLRIDTRDGGFSLWDRDGLPLHPDEVVAAIDKLHARYPQARRPPMLTQSKRHPSFPADFTQYRFSLLPGTDADGTGTEGNAAKQFGEPK